MVALEPKPAQLRVWEAAWAQRQAGEPVRLIVPKARKEGVSTFAVSHLIQRATMRPNTNCISVAQDSETAGELLQMGTMIHAHLPDSPEWPIKPPIANRLRRKELAWGNPSRASQQAGDLGINSRFISDTASEYEAGRGFTYHGVHGSEVALWRDIKRKLGSLLNAVPDDPETFVILESTSKGFNHWRTLCHAARDGENDFALVFLPWFEEPQYQRRFLSDSEREEFAKTIGDGPWGEDEPGLVEDFGLSLEQLNWRRWAIANRTQGDLDLFKQEYPSTLDESFLATGATVFSQAHVSRAARRVRAPIATANMAATEYRQYRSGYGVIAVPTKPELSPGTLWRIWAMPEPDGRYVLGADPAGDDTADPSDRAMHAAVIIDHRSREQVAEVEFQGDTDRFAEQILLGALFYNRATVAVESTGSWGIPVLRRIYRDWRYPHVYRRKRLVDGKETDDERLGFDTNRTTKGFLIEAGREMLREGTHGIASEHIVRQMTTFVRDSRTRFGPSKGERADLLMAYLIAHLVAHETPVRHAGLSEGVISTTTRPATYSRTGY